MHTQTPGNEFFNRIQVKITQQLSEAIPTTLFPLTASEIETSPSPQPLSTLLDKHLTGPELVLLLLADAGMGKTVCLQALVQRLLSEWREENPIPVYLSLATLKTSFVQLLQDFFFVCGFTLEEVVSLKAQHTFIVIADGYDASLGFVPLCQGPNDNILGWRINKWIISCRTNYFFNSLDFDYRALFAYYQGNQRIEPQVIQLLPLSQAVIQSEIKTSLDSTCQGYLAKDEALLALSSNPLMLHLLLKQMPEMVRQPKATAYQQLLTHWIAYQIERLKTYGLIESSQYELMQQAPLWYVVSMARRLHELREVAIHLHSEDSFDLEGMEAITAGWQRFLQTEDKLTVLARACCPVQSSSPDEVSFFNPKLVEQIGRLEIELPKDKAQLPAFLNGYEGSEQLAAALNTELKVNDAEYLSAFKFTSG